jgi:hypothetical protein
VFTSVEVHERQEKLEEPFLIERDLRGMQLISGLRSRERKDITCKVSKIRKRAANYLAILCLWWLLACLVNWEVSIPLLVKAC